MNKPGLAALEMARVSDDKLTKLDEEFADIVKTNKAKVKPDLFEQLAER